MRAATTASATLAPAGDVDAWLRLSDYIAAKLGLHFPKSRLADLRRNFAKASAEFGFTDEIACIRWLLSSPKTPAEVRATTQVLARHLTIGETYFLRDRPALEAFESHILPALIRSRRLAGNRRLRIWCAACCTGEEAYTLAMIVHRLLPDIGEWDVTITGTDLNADFLDRARNASYGEWSFRDAPAWLRANYFSRTTDGRYVVRPEIRRMVRFFPLNLVDAASHMAGSAVRPEILAMDVIFCRNVLMYFTPQNIEKALVLLDRSLVDGGWLAVGPGETPAVAHRNLSATPFPGAVLLRKTAAEKTVGGEAGVSSPFKFDDSLRLAAIAATPVAEAVAAKRSSAEIDDRAELAKLAELGEAFDFRARAYANQGNTAMALEQCDRWLLADKLNAAAHYLRGIILMERGDASAAEQSLQRAIYLDETFALAYVALGHAAAGRGDVARSEKHYARARSLVDAMGPQAPVPGGGGLTGADVAESLRAISKFTRGAKHG